MGLMVMGEKRMSFTEFAITWREQMGIANNPAARLYNATPSDPLTGEDIGRTNREMVLFRANRIAEAGGHEKPFKLSDADRRYEDFTDEQREYIIHALNEIIRFSQRLPSFISLAYRKLNITCEK
ncbi:hypothetical protein [Serratia marcescens]|uniref:hypothetical protein n=1 Tax=Serratia marcescens TaxID=615 RepID=UPI001B914504|nr:hypothetical protein [Serratia marcescens]CAI1949082.1 Uncharacterised protein [Serratia marcescens]HBC7417595.1 hypothetical protein [Serratia marcescens]